jgi:hypothetical protein
VSETDVERDLVGGRVFGRSDGSQSASLLARSTSKGHHQKERAPKESVNNADGCEHANALQTLALESSQQFVEIAVVIRIARHGWTGYRCHHSARFVLFVFFSRRRRRRRHYPQGSISPVLFFSRVNVKKQKRKVRKDERISE